MKKRKLVLPSTYSLGELGKYTKLSSLLLTQLGWPSFFHLHQQLSINLSIHTLAHPSAPYLHHLACRGVPAPSMAPPQPVRKKDLAYTQGPPIHRPPIFGLPSSGYVRNGAHVCYFNHLKLAPAGVVPQQERRPRPIIDYTFNSIKQQSLPVAPTAAMQFGNTFQGIIQHIVYANPVFGPPVMAKIDVADGYYRVPLSSTVALQLAVSNKKKGFVESWLAWAVPGITIDAPCRPLFNAF
jgi:hypothetical protein